MFISISLFLFSGVVGSAQASDGSDLAWRKCDYRLHAIESFPGTFRDRLIESAGLYVEGTGREDDFINALYRVLPWRRYRVRRDKLVSMRDGRAADVDEIGFSLANAGLFKTLKSVGLDFYQNGKKVARLDFSHGEGTASALLGVNHLNLNIRRPATLLNRQAYDKRDLIMISFDREGRVSHIHIYDVNESFGSVRASTLFHVLPDPEPEPEYGQFEDVKR
jgi:hypothetical protein